MLFRSSEPLDDFRRHDADEADYEAKCPVCDSCGRPITDETYFEISGEILCEECMRDSYLRHTDNYIKEREENEVSDFEG